MFVYLFIYFGPVVSLLTNLFVHFLIDFCFQYSLPEGGVAMHDYTIILDSIRRTEEGQCARRKS